MAYQRTKAKLNEIRSACAHVARPFLPSNPTVLTRKESQKHNLLASKLTLYPRSRTADGTCHSTATWPTNGNPQSKGLPHIKFAQPEAETPENPELKAQNQESFPPPGSSARPSCPGREGWEALSSVCTLILSFGI